MEKDVKNPTYSLLENLVEQSKYQNQILGKMLNYFDTIICQLEKIGISTCTTVNEVHKQTNLQKEISSHITFVLEILKQKNPDAVIHIKELEELKTKLEHCCPKPEKNETICDYVSCIKTNKDSSGNNKTEEGVSISKFVKGAPFKPVIKKDNPLYPSNQRPSRVVPKGLFKGLIYESKGSGIKQPGGADDPVVFTKYELNSSVAQASNNAADISGGDSGQVVMLTGNWYVQYSTDAGQTFNTINPTTIFPNTLMGGFCCDQVIQFIPSINRFVWLLQYSQVDIDPTSGVALRQNAYRIASASPQDIINSNCTAWTYWDLTSASFGLGTDWMDYPSLSVGDNFLYMSFDAVDSVADTLNDTGLVIARFPLNEIQLGGTINYRYTFPNDSAVAYGSNTTQNTGNEVFWAGHIDNSTMRVFSWHENSTSIFWRSVDVNNWANANQISNGPNGNNWFGHNLAAGWQFPGFGVIGATRRGNEIWFAWTASNGNGGSGGFNFPHPHIQIAKIEIGTYRLIEQTQVWNPDHAFGYPCLATNANNEVGIALGWGGGGTFNANTAVGIMGDYVVWYRDGSTWTHSRWGDYVSVRQAAPDGNLFAGFGFITIDTSTPAGANHRFDPYYVLFGRKSQSPPIG